MFQSRSLSNKIYLKERLFGFRMDQAKSLEANLDEFLKMTIELANSGDKEELSDENKAIIILNSLPEAYREINNRSTNSNADKKCFYCNKMGHLKKDCYSWIKKTKENQASTSQVHQDSANFGDGYSDGEVLMASGKLKASEWILDSGCTYHMTHNKHWLSDYQELNEGKVIMGNNHSCSVAGIGSVSIKMADGVVRILENVRWVPELSRNLISIGILDDLGYTNKIEQGSMYIAKGATILKGMKIGGLYYLIGETLYGVASVATTQDHSKATLWHRRLGHISEKGLQLMSKQNLLGKDKEQGNYEQEITSHSNSEQSLQQRDYILTRDREKRVSRPLQRYGFSA
ncbi:hypothetical protein AXG93_4510s1170 [Marchantia polymorpha subsp. ruderalis]|uniref:CCHC-type domain-containing protein n=1 Tax=Marchantia polymorpha subsp. ruderalis TaxID=1480154 RepID=A0A176WFF8_MARPO|nr:hypothetical protein AXG93_4510s1170 [Marchantia polymorpha subsp. ruderalis]